MVVDVTECPLQRPSNFYFQREVYSGRTHQHSLKYEVGVELTTGLYVWFQGAYPGSWNDLTIARSSGLLTKLKPGELLLADKIYVGEPQIITPFKEPKSEIEEKINSILYSHRIIVENSLSRIKTFNCTQQKWRHSPFFHSKVFKVLINILNIDLYFGPL